MNQYKIRHDTQDKAVYPVYHNLNKFLYDRFYKRKNISHFYAQITVCQEQSAPIALALGWIYEVTQTGAELDYVDICPEVS